MQELQTGNHKLREENQKDKQLEKLKRGGRRRLVRGNEEMTVGLKDISSNERKYRAMGKRNPRLQKERR